MPQSYHGQLTDLYRPLSRAILLPIVMGTITSSRNRIAVRTWYRGLRRWYYQLPNWAFSVLWPTTYVLMGYASHRVAQRLSCLGEINGARVDTRTDGGTANSIRNVLLDPFRFALPAYTLQLLLNCAFSPLFFGMQLLGWADAVLVACFATSAWASVLFGRVDRTAGWIMAGYTCILGYASASFTYIWYNNRRVGSDAEDAEEE